MSCLFYFKEKGKGRGQRSAPVLKEESKSDVSRTERAAISSCSASSHLSFSEVYEGKAQNLRVFSFSELRQGTNNFSRLLKIGEGGFGCVYKGKIKPVDGNGEPVVVAIKKLNRDGYQGHKQWVAEVQFLGVVEHPNLVKLIGYCGVDGERGIQRLLVYEFMQNKSLEDHLFSKAYPALTWQRRLQIVLGAARGLAYLHEELEVQVIYRDFKSSNVLLDNDFKPKLSDFGLAREGPTGLHTHVSTAAVGTYGYAAPDYIETGHLTAKSDVWSFGVVLYEILTGRRSIERSRPSSEQKLLSWIKHYPAESRKFSTIMDPRLENQYSESAARRIAKLADSCLSKSPKARPKMSQVVETLQQIIQSCSENSPSFERFQSAAEDSADDDQEPEQNGPTESEKRRMAHLAKLSERVGGLSRKGFMIMQRAKVT
nr:probable serine/threonine-protein kinase PBL19 [Ipomoea batatas]GMD62148.1 probable serine/threonine-protein kinase PBL19 [Ipomoea batatas]